MKNFEVIFVFLLFTVFESVSSYCLPCNEPPAQWSEWSEWSLCTQQYGAYSKTRTRTCLSGNTNSVTSDCTGHSEEAVACLDQPVGPQWNSWGAWSGCSASCGGGFQYRQRTCDTQCGVCQCQGETTEQRKCHTNPCCKWKEWSEWGQCSVTCGVGGVHTRTRRCTCKHCPSGNARQTKSCAVPACPVPCQVCQPTPPPCNVCNPPPPPCSACGYYGRKKRQAALEQRKLINSMVIPPGTNFTTPLRPGNNTLPIIIGTSFNTNNLVDES